MIIRDENGRAVGVERLSDVTKEVNEIESIFDKAVKNKKNGGSMPQEEKDALKMCMEVLTVLISSVEDNVKKNANAMEVIAFVKALTKLKKFADSAKSELEND